MAQREGGNRPSSSGNAGANRACAALRTVYSAGEIHQARYRYTAG